MNVVPCSLHQFPTIWSTLDEWLNWFLESIELKSRFCILFCNFIRELATRETYPEAIRYPASLPSFLPFYQSSLLPAIINSITKICVNFRKPKQCRKVYIRKQKKKRFNFTNQRQWPLPGWWLFPDFSLCKIKIDSVIMMVSLI